MIVKLRISCGKAIPNAVAHYYDKLLGIPYNPYKRAKFCQMLIVEFIREE